MIILGVLISILSVLNMKGDIRSIHWYNRTKVKESDIPKYGKVVGLGTLIIGISLILNGLVQLIFKKAFDGIMIAGVITGCCIMLYGQIKYNKGIF